MALKLSNREARRLWLDAQGLSAEPTGKLTAEGLLDIIKHLGFVQLDTIRVVARAHDHILWSRNQNYREPMLHKALADHRHVFEHFTHDASVIPMEIYPHWRRQFRRMGKATSSGNWGSALPTKRVQNAIYKRIEEEGPLCTRDFESNAKKKKAWSRPPHKVALDHMWYAGRLATSHRKNFIKFYDVAERVIPEHLHTDKRDDAAQIDWLCNGALDRLGFGTPSDIQKFWNAATPKEVKIWSDNAGADHVPVEIKGADGGTIAAVAPAEIEARLAALPEPSSRLRIINPFDPVARDRNRLTKLFGFDYRIEIFVPAAKRAYGYYVYPLLEGDRFVGRIEIASDRNANTLTVLNLWGEPGVRPSKARAKKLDAELARLGRLVGAKDIIWNCPRMED